MYNPKQTGFFPLVQAKVEEGLSNEVNNALCKDFLKIVLVIL